VTVTTIWEERWTTLQPRAFAAYRTHCLDRIWPLLVANGATPLGLFNALIGASAEEALSVTGYQSLDHYAAVQADLSAARPRLLDEAVRGAALAEFGALERRVSGERVRLLRDCGVRPKPEPAIADRKPIYGVRHFFVAEHDWPEFVETSSAGVWPRIESQGACILGMFRDLAAVEPLDVLLLTGYDGPAHWEATRGLEYSRPEGFTEEAWRRTGELARRRPALVQSSHVWLMRAHWPDVTP